MKFQVGDWVTQGTKGIANRLHGVYRVTKTRESTPGGSAHTIFLDKRPNGGAGWRADCHRLATVEEIRSVPIEVGDLADVEGNYDGMPALLSDPISIGRYNAERRRGGWRGGDWRHATPAEYRRFHMEDEEMEASDFGEKITLDPEKVEAQLGEHEQRIKDTESEVAANLRGIQSLDSRIARIEASPPKPEIEDPFVYSLFGGKRYIQLTPSVDGSSRYGDATGENDFYYDAQFTKDKRQCVAPDQEPFEQGKRAGRRLAIDWYQVAVATGCALLPLSALLGAYCGWMGI